jgi:two-component system, NtrC family, sensor histidine kinase PilS
MSKLMSEGRSSGLAPLEIDDAPQLNQDSAFIRLWRAFMTARVGVAVALVIMQAVQHLLAPQTSLWPLLLCGAYVLASSTVWFTSPSAPKGSFLWHHWTLTIGVDVAVLGLLQWLQPHSIDYAPLLTLPVLLGSVMGSLTLALASASAVTLYLLTLALRLLGQVNADPAAAFFQAGLTGMGYFVMAILANQTSTRLLGEEERASRSQQAARLQTQVNELVIESLSDGVMVIDSSGTVRSANPSALKLTGPDSNRLALPFALKVAPGWQPLLDIANASFAERTSLARDLVIQHAGESRRRVHVRTKLTSIGETQVESLCVAFIENLPELEARLRKEKIAAMGRMSAAVAHEIRNPLAAITQANALLAEDLTHPAQQQLAGMIAQNAGRLARIVDDVLNATSVTRDGSASSNRLLLDDVVSRSAQDWCSQIEAGDCIRLLLAAEGFEVIFDAEHLRRVLVNLLDNALRYCSKQPGSIAVATKASSRETENGWLWAGHLCVWSDGEVLDPTVESHLFEPFFSSESRSSGLGLYICRELCERHGAVLGYARQASPAGTGQGTGNGFFVDFKLQRAAQHLQSTASSIG